MPLTTAENPACDECASPTEKIWKLSLSHVPGGTYPFVTKNISGKPIEVTSAAHLAQLCKQYGVEHRPDNAWIEKTYTGWDHQKKMQTYKEGRGVGLPGSWF